MNKRGLSQDEAKERLERFGRNELQRTKKISPLKIFIEQFTSPLLILLVIAAIILGAVNYFSAESNDIIDVVLILAIVLISGVSGFAQDYKAERSIEALQEMSAPKTKVMRDGRLTILPASLVVPDDILVLSEGDIIPADAKLITANNAEVDESILTGESSVVGKKTGSEVYMNTYLVSGNLTAKVTNTGMGTKVGAIAHELESIVEEKTPFYIEMDKLSRKLFWIVVVIAVLTALAGLLHYSLTDSILSAIALAVAAIPEGLPAVLVLSLAVGSKVMLGNNALVRRLSVIESIGSVNVICADKTGTITKDEMSVTKILFENKVYDFNNVDSEEITPLLFCNVLNNNSREVYDKNGKKIVGDETEIALLNFAQKFGFDKNAVDKKYRRIFEAPFDAKRKMMSIVVKDQNRYVVYTKGAPEMIMQKCDKILINGRIERMTNELRKRILDTNSDFASNALRVLGFAFKEVDDRFERKKESLERNLIFLGLEGITDPPREGVADAIKTCKTAGINVIMLTGDNALTAKSIAREVGIETKGVLTGSYIDELDDRRLSEFLADEVRVYARLTPEHKLRIMTLLQKQGNIVAMTGDGVNDALALKKADVGVAMGVRGTDVAKQASDLILLDDNFVTIVAAIKEGRRVYDNIKKFTNYLLTSNFAEVAVIFLATLFLTLNQPILLPVELLWINLLTDGFPALALGVDPARPRVMEEPPRKKTSSVLDRRLMWLTGAIGIKKTIILFVTFFLTLYLTQDHLIARTTIFTGFILYEFVRIGVIRHQELLGWFSNKFLLIALIVSLILQVLIIYTPINSLFGITPMYWISWTILISGVLIGYFLAIWITNIIVKHVPE